MKRFYGVKNYLLYNKLNDMQFKINPMKFIDLIIPAVEIRQTIRQERR